MKFTKIIALSLATLSLISLTACAKKVCDVCKIDPPVHSVNSNRKVDLCEYCYQRVVMLETDADVEIIKATEFDALTQKQKNYIVIYTKESIDGYDATNIDGLSIEQIREKVYAEAATKYGKTADQIKAILADHDAVRESKSEK